MNSKERECNFGEAPFDNTGTVPAMGACWMMAKASNTWWNRIGSEVGCVGESIWRDNLKRRAARDFTAEILSQCRRKKPWKERQCS
jgi:hypothetical protein